MIKKFSSILVAFFIVFSFAVIVSAEETTATNTTTTSGELVTKIACVKTAIATREASLAGAVSTHNASISAAYATRANELAGAYSNTTTKAVQNGVRTSWADFNKTLKAANKTWRTNRDTVWTTYKTALKACKAPSQVSDHTNASGELAN